MGLEHAGLVADAKTDSDLDGARGGPGAGHRRGLGRGRAASGPGAAGPWRITTLAGGVGGPGPASQIAGGECAVTFAGGYLYATGYSYAPSVIRRISMSTGALTTPVGSAFTAPGAATDGTPAARASIARSCGLTTDAHGNLFFTDQGDLVEMVPATTGSYFGQPMTAGHVYIIGGNGTDGHSGDGGPAVDAKLSIPAGVTVDPAGNVIFDDSNNDVLRVIAATSGTFYSQAMTAGDIYTVAGGGSDYAHGGIPATSALLELENAGGEYPGVMPWPLVAEDQAGNIVLDDGGADGEALVEVVAGRTGTFYGQAMTAGDIYIIGGTGLKTASGVPARQATFGMSSGVALDHAGNILVADAANHRLDVIAVKAGRFYGRTMKAEYAYRLAGNGKEGLASDGGPATRAEFSGPDGVTVDSAGNIVLADGQGGGFDSQFDNGRLRVVAARAGSYYGVKMKAGDIYTISGARGHSYYGDGGPADRALLDTTELFGDRAGRHRDGGYPIGRRRLRRPGQQPDPDRARGDGDVLRPAAAGGRHLHDRGQRASRIRDRPRNPRRAAHSGGRGAGRQRQRGAGRRREQPGPGRRGAVGPVLRPGHEGW